MREVTTPESGTLTALAAAGEPPEDPRERAVFYWTRANHLARRAVEDAWRCGQALNEAKAALPYGAWYPWLESKNIAKRTAARWMELAREVQICQLGRYDNVDAALNSVAKRRLDAYAAGPRFALEQDLAELRGGAPISVAPQDRAGDDRAADDRTADIVPLRESSGDDLENENYALKAELVDAHDHVDDLKEQLALARENRGGNHEFERDLVKIGKLQDRLRSTTASLRECGHHRQLAEQECQRLYKRLRDLGEHIRP